MSRIKRLRADGKLRCYLCGEFKTPESFCLDSSRKCGRDTVCRECNSPYKKEYQARYYQEHRDKLLPLHRESAARSYRNRREGIPCG